MRNEVTQEIVAASMIKKVDTVGGDVNKNRKPIPQSTIEQRRRPN